MTDIDLTASPRDTILDAAARCFMDRGFNATSIDDIASRLGATKGMVYHYFSSKADLFFEIHQIGMDALFKAVEPLSEGTDDAVSKLRAMSAAHVHSLIQTQHYQRAVAEGVQMHLRISTTRAQRAQLTRLQNRRRRYEQMFLEVLEQGIGEGKLRAEQPRIAIKPLFGALNSVINWYQPRRESGPGARDEVVEEVVRVALAGVVVPGKG
ncbi:MULTISPECIES: TetR/AcrR family transcriptional regulator [Alloalcanivorax]|jgi:AcrR family transcriptional regulator|uniref:Transcriptional regulator, TetR family protein n=2 Tax=Alloalcanivorax TaxID=3020832 RepID=K0CB93_ALCDB|nr:MULTISPECIES: TetR/AcrR family transcriptional regulator [Alloalcanivorax]ERS15055.1 TetR family transcriptional regulator [Alcanivorax sp. PN-3]MBA4722116.1 TetR/AcrR family transcriptional regulator [Alcanivorax sp.]AFT69898.1 Transcriptional regulator, TetR family protein [Alloalcanivorax dieselolei B5]ARB45315.1 TetR family transcriptional regulator [Alloalcanivorax xenomutans]MCE7507569.1 TetR/AcrR family transcriptional regulator [Alloalcanivorax xenomutans]